jgi:hypothetical protein
VGNIEDAHHEQMAATFIESIGSALAEYDNNQQDMDYYYLAWGALFETNAWNTVVNFYDYEEDPYSIIDAGANNPFVNTNADLGAIIVSGFTSTNWTISTIQTPETETQPFSGNRQWGLLINQNGNLEFYTRAVDVARVADIFLEWPATWLGSDIDCQQDTYYDIAEATWQNMQQEIADWINDDEISHGGQATVNTPKAARVNKDKIIEILTTNESIEQILSNCN